MKIGHLNVRSLPAHFAAVKDLIVIEAYDVFALTETWLYPGCDYSLFCIEHYSHFFTGRITRTGGGVGIYVRDGYSVEVVMDEVLSFIEQLWVRIRCKDMVMMVGVIYRPDIGMPSFLDTLDATLSSFVPLTENLICLGDFNIDLLDFLGQYRGRYLSLIESFGLRQVIEAATRVTSTSASLIDHIIVTSDTRLVGAAVVPVHNVADHAIVCIELCFAGGPTSEPRPISFRDFKHFNRNNFARDLSQIPWNEIIYLENIDDKVCLFNHFILSLFDVHAPFRVISARKNFRPWITDNIKLLMKLRDDAYSKFKRTKCERDYLAYKELRNFTNSSVQRERKAYLEYMLNTKSSRELWGGFRRMGILNTRQRSIPEGLVDVDALNDFFLSSQNNSQGDTDLITFFSSNVIPTVTEKLEFSLASEEEVMDMLVSIKTNAIGFDGVSAEMLVLCCPVILPYICHIVNFCLEFSVFPDCWRVALVTPMPKTTNPSNYNDLRPISILPAISKILERFVACQLREHLETFSILPDTQSGFRKGYSCATALLEVIDTIIRGRDIGKTTVLVLLDFSKAFDTVHHRTLLAILWNSGLSRNACAFFEHYLMNRRQRVSFDGNWSDEAVVLSGVPQGSILGPILYLIYTSNLFGMLHHCNMHMYADDTQLHYSFDPAQMHIAQNYINFDLDKLIHRASQLCLNINPSKSSMMVFGNQSAVAHVRESFDISVCGVNLQFSNEAKNLGVTIDSSLRFRAHISNLLKRAYAALRLLYGNRNLLNRRLRIQLCDSIVLSLLNYCDVIYDSCLDVATTLQIQRLQNACLRFIYGIKRRNRISHTLVWANWLNMSQRRRLHSACFFHRLVLSGTPPYLSTRIRYRCDVHNINVRHRFRLSIPRYRTQLFKRSFSYVICSVYNSIPLNILQRSELGFKTAFKMYLLQ